MGEERLGFGDDKLSLRETGLGEETLSLGEGEGRLDLGEGGQPGFGNCRLGLCKGKPALGEGRRLDLSETGLGEGGRGGPLCRTYLGEERYKGDLGGGGRPLQRQDLPGPMSALVESCGKKTTIHISTVYWYNPTTPHISTVYWV